jgi:hypothetical protein
MKLEFEFENQAFATKERKEQKEWNQSRMSPMQLL